jgi:AraC family transcriptional regulator
VSGGQEVQLWNSDGAIRRVVRAGTIAVVFPGNPGRVDINGRADTIQIIVRKQLVEAIASRSGISLVPLGACELPLQAAGAQALVALRRDSRSQRTELERIVREMLPWLAAFLSRPLFKLAGGGLSPAAQRKVHALIDKRVELIGCSPLSLSELAAAAGLSVHHFVKAFRQTEGMTPYASVIARRLDVALALLVQPRARVDWIAEQAGFSSSSHFVSAFRQHLGITPGAVCDAANAYR